MECCQTQIRHTIPIGIALQLYEDKNRSAVMTVNFLRRALKTATRFLRALLIQGVLYWSALRRPGGGGGTIK
jgi:hypothetical protein